MHAERRAIFLHGDPPHPRRSLKMPLSRELAKKINRTAGNDPELRRRIKNVNYVFLPNHLGITGAVRNAMMFARGKDPTELAVANRVCTGIAEQAMKAINSRLAELPEVKSANTVSRVSWTVHHTATVVELKDGSRYVFDWHKTLDIDDPFVGEESHWIIDADQINLGRFRGLQ
jgi:hypothetical protein